MKSLYRPAEALRAPRDWSSQISRQSLVSPTHRPPLPPGDAPCTHSSYRLNQPQNHCAAGRIKSIKNPNDPSRNWTCNLPACGTVPQPTAPPHTPLWKKWLDENANPIVLDVRDFRNWYECFIVQCQASGSWPVACRKEGLSSIPGLSFWDLWWTIPLWQVLLCVLQFSFVTILPLVRHTHTH
jgi:hypothetical protein